MMGADVVMDTGSGAYIYGALLVPLPNGTIPTIPTAKLNGSGLSYPVATYSIDGVVGKSLNGNPA